MAVDVDCQTKFRTKFPKVPRTFAREFRKAKRNYIFRLYSPKSPGKLLNLHSTIVNWLSFRFIAVDVLPMQVDLLFGSVPLVRFAWISQEIVPRLLFIPQQSVIRSTFLGMELMKNGVIINLSSTGGKLKFSFLAKHWGILISEFLLWPDTFGKLCTWLAIFTPFPRRKTLHGNEAAPSRTKMCGNICFQSITKPVNCCAKRLHFND